MVRSLIHIVSALDATEMLISCSCLAAAGDSIDSLFCSLLSGLPPSVAAAMASQGKSSAASDAPPASTR